MHVLQLTGVETVAYAAPVRRKVGHRLHTGELPDVHVAYLIGACKARETFEF